MTDEQDRYLYWDAKARNVVECTDCSPESHIRTIRYLLTEAYEDGRRDYRREQWGLAP